jgi:hypothetical protein
MNGLLNGLLTPSIPPTSSDKVTASRPNRGGAPPISGCGETRVSGGVRREGGSTPLAVGR